MYGLDLFSGIGGITKALEQWVVPLAYVEKDAYAQGVLLSRMECGDLPRAPIWDDISTLKPVCLPKLVIDIVYGGFPCQDISVAGNGVGLGGERSGLFQHIARIVKETNPKFVFLENVPAIRTRGLNCVVQTFTELGYDCRWTIVSAAEVGAVHIRKRWFLLAYANGERLRKKQWKEFATSERSVEPNSKSSPESLAESPSGKIEPRVVRTGDGIPFVVDRNRALGNSVVPAQARKAFIKLMGIK